MEKFTKLTGVAAPLSITNIDTDMIIGSNTVAEFGDFAIHDNASFANPTFNLTT